MSKIDGIEEMILRLDGDAVVTWFETHAQGAPDEIRLFRQWRRIHGTAEVAKVDGELGRRLTLLRRLSTHTVPGAEGALDLAEAADVRGGDTPVKNGW